MRGLSTRSKATAARAIDSTAELVAEESASNSRRLWKTKGAVALFGALCLVPGPYARWKADTDKSHPTKSGALRRVGEDAGAEGEGTPFHAYPFGHSVPARAKERCDSVGFDFSNNRGIRWGMFCCDAYWNEFASYAITPAAKTELEVATYTLHSMVLEMVDEVVNDKSNTCEQNANPLSFCTNNAKIVIGALCYIIDMRLFEIPEELHDAVRSSWRNRQQDLYGRFDLLWDGNGPPKMLE